MEEKELDFVVLMKKKRCSLFFKRIFDIVASFLGLLFLAIPFVIIAIAIKATSEGPVFFKQVRVGKNGKEFKIFKFRTMIVNAEQKGLQITSKEDCRVTKVGKIIRKLKIDELPQLLNVFLGQMSLVGPRPEVPKYVELYNEEQKKVLFVKPGITDLASIEYCDENDLIDASDNPEKTYIEEIMPKKLALNMEYIKRLGFFYDIGLIFRTFIRILK